MERGVVALTNRATIVYEARRRTCIGATILFTSAPKHAGASLVRIRPAPSLGICFSVTWLVLSTRNENSPVSILERLGEARGANRGALAKPTKTAEESYAIAAEEFAAELAKIRRILETDIKAIEAALDAAGAPATPGRLPKWGGD